MEGGSLEDRLRHRLVHHILAEERWTAKFVPAAQFFVHLPRKFVMGCGIGVKWDGDDDIFQLAFHMFFGHGFASVIISRSARNPVLNGLTVLAAPSLIKFISPLGDLWLQVNSLTTRNWADLTTH